MKAKIGDVKPCDTCGKQSNLLKKGDIKEIGKEKKKKLGKHCKLDKNSF